MIRKKCQEKVSNRATNQMESNKIRKTKTENIKN